MMFPAVHGAVGLVAAGSRDSCVYVWRRRSSRAGREEGRSMRSSTMYTLDGHKVHPDPSRGGGGGGGGWKCQLLLTASPGPRGGSGV